MKPKEIADAKIHIKPFRAPYRSESQWILIGQSAAGKDYILRKLCEEFGYPKLVSHTTRPPRPHEVDGVDYFFASHFDPETTPHVEYRRYETVENGEPAVWYYWLSPQQAQQNSYVGILDFEGSVQLRDWSYEYLGKRPIFVYVWASEDTLRRRAMKRPGFEELEFERRMQVDLGWEQDAINFVDVVFDNDEEENHE